MNIRIANLWNKLKTNFWLIPGMMTLLAFGLSLVTLNWDRSVNIQEFQFYSPWQGGAEGARELLSTIAGSLITITGVVFSITTVALAITSNQYGSKLLPSFMRDLGTQIVLGTFISTSIYAFLILRTIRKDNLNGNVEAFIPNFSITISIGLAIVSLSMLIYFIHHLSIRIQSTDIIARVSCDLIEMIEKSMENQNFKVQVENFDKERECKELVFSSKMGYLQTIDYKFLFDLAKRNQMTLAIDIRPGHFLRKKSILAKVSTSLSENTKKSISKAFTIGKERNSTQDIEYAIDQLVAIALRALSLNANDTFTANTCIDYLGASLCLICEKKVTTPYYDENPYIRLTSKQETFNGLVDASFNEIRQYGSSHPSILIHLLETLTSILSCSQTQEQREALKKHAIMINDAGSRLLEDKDRQEVRERFAQFNFKFEEFLLLLKSHH